MAKKPVKRKIPDFRRAAHQHLEAGRVLLESGGFRLQAMYLAGYAVECALKAMLVSRTPLKRQPQLIDSFRGAVSHDYEHLKARLAKLKCNLPKEVVRQCGRSLLGRRTCATRLASGTTPKPVRLSMPPKRS